MTRDVIGAILYWLPEDMKANGKHSAILAHFDRKEKIIRELAGRSYSNQFSGVPEEHWSYQRGKDRYVEEEIKLAERAVDKETSK